MAKKNIEWQKPVFIVSKNKGAAKYLTILLNTHSQIALTCQSGLPAFFKYSDIVSRLHNLERFDDGAIYLIGLIPDVNRALFDKLYDKGTAALRQRFYKAFFRDKNFTRWGDTLDDAAMIPDLLAKFPDAQFIDLQTAESAGSAENAVKPNEKPIRELLQPHANTLAIQYEKLLENPQKIVGKILAFLALTAEPGKVEKASQRNGAISAAHLENESKAAGTDLHSKNVTMQNGSSKAGFPGIAIAKNSGKWPNTIQWDTPVFVVSAGRSGSTHLNHILNAHPDMALTSEAYLTHIFQMINYFAELPYGNVLNLPPLKLRGLVAEPYQSVFAPLNRESTRTFLQEFYMRHFYRKKFTRWGDKFQFPVAIPKLLEEFPKSQFIFLMRDGRDRTVSVVKFHKHLRESNPHLPPHSFTDQCNIWKYSNLQLQNMLKDHPHTLFVRYEKLIEKPYEATKKILTFLNLSQAPSVFEYIDQSTASLFASHGTSSAPKASIGRWKTEMTDEEKEIAHKIMGKELLRFGYEVNESENG